MNNFYNPYAGGQFYGYNNQAQTMPRVKNLLSNEEINMLRQTVEQFNLSLTQEEQLKGKCNHRDQNGMTALVDNPDGTKRCTICGEIITMKDYSEEDVAAIVEEAVNVLNTIKLLFGEMPTAAAAEFYMIQPLLKKLPKLMKIATANYSKYDNMNQLNAYNGANQFGMYNAVMGGPAMMGTPYQPTYYDPNMQMGQPVVQANPYQPMGTVPADQNPFYASGYQMNNGYQPQPQGFAYQPQPQGFAYQPGMAQVAPQTQVAPQQVVAQPAVSTPAPAAPAGGEVQVNAQLKA